MVTLTSPFGSHACEISIQNNICDQAMNSVRYWDENEKLYGYKYSEILSSLARFSPDIIRRVRRSVTSSEANG